MKRFCIIFSIASLPFLTFISQPTFAQQKVKFGKVSQKELEMTQYDKDTTASAVVLYDKGVLDARTLNFTRHYRIKILKKSGYDWANKVLEIPSKSSVRGYTFNLENDKVERTKLTNESVFQEEVVEDFYVLKIFMPNVKVGSVIEIQYSHFLPPFMWKFQEEIPVAYSELELQHNTYINFSKNMLGYGRVETIGPDHWMTRNMPALKPEPFINSLNNYITRVEMEIRSINLPGVFYRDYATDWRQVYKTLNDSESFGKELDRMSFMKSEAKDILEKYSTDEEKLQAAYKFIHENIKWNGISRLYASNDLTTIFKKDKIGNSADVNLSLISLLRKMDYDVRTIVLSTVDHGMLSFAVPSLDKLNYVVGYLKLNGKEYLLDATEPDLPMGMLPNRCLNGNARLMGEYLNEWIDLTPSDKKYKESISAEFTLDETGSLTGKISCERADYAALEFRKELKEESNEEKYIENLEVKYNGLRINDYSLINKDEEINDPVKEEFDVGLTDMMDDLGGTVAFTPLFFRVSYENPFKLENRIFPVHFKQPISKNYVVRLSIPEGYSFVNLPQPVNVALPDNGGKFMYSAAKVNDTEVQIFYRLEINSTIFVPETYPYLQKLYSIIIDSVSKQLLIKSKT